jgi:hypothetical protein
MRNPSVLGGLVNPLCCRYILKMKFDIRNFPPQADQPMAEKLENSSAPVLKCHKKKFEIDSEYALNGRKRMPLQIEIFY